MRFTAASACLLQHTEAEPRTSNKSNGPTTLSKKKKDRETLRQPVTAVAAVAGRGGRLQGAAGAEPGLALPVRSSGVSVASAPEAQLRRSGRLAGAAAVLGVLRQAEALGGGSGCSGGAGAGRETQPFRALPRQATSAPP